MVPDDRDRNLDQALARHFRPSASDRAAAISQPVSEFAAAPSAFAPALSACPDAEILAAYHDGSLAPEELALWKSHVLACSDCQLVLEHLGAPLDAPVALETSAPALISAQSDRPLVTFPTAAASPATSKVAASAPISSTPAAAAPVSVARPRKSYFRWLVPTGAIAAGLLTWAVIHESGIPKLAPESTALRLQTAENHPPASPSDAANSTAPANREPQRVSPAPSSDNERQLSPQVDQLKQNLARQKEQKEKDGQALDSSAAVVAGYAGKTSQQNAAPEQQLRDRLQSAQPLARRYGAAPSNGPRLTQQQQQAQFSSREPDSGAAILDKKAPASADLVAPRDEPNFVEPGSISPPPAKVAKAVPAPPPPPPAPPTDSASGASSASAPKPAAADKSRASDDAVGALTQTVTVESNLSSANMLRTAAVDLRGPQTFNDPAHKSLWRVGPAGSVEFSADNGATWAPQSSGISADLFTGSAPGAKVCWVVGAKGAMLRTTDTGRHWLKLNAPVAADILGIHATDAFHATIWLVVESQSSAVATYKTSDGALTWSLVPNN
jgi:hypothetical protein